MTKVVLINAVSPYLELIDYHDNPIPYGLGYLVAAVRQAMPEIDISIAYDMDDLLARKPDIVGISSMTDNYAIAVEWGRLIKDTLNVPIIIGGVHISLAPNSIKRCFDVAVIGEGEITFVELLQSIIKHKKIDYADLINIPGLYFYVQGKPVLTAKRLLIKDLDSIPIPGKDVLPITSSSYLPYVFSARGCPYNCSFCSAKEIFQGYRSHSIDYFIRQIKRLVLEEHVRHIYLADDLFFANKGKLEKLIEELYRQNLLGKCSYSCWARANLVSEEVCRLLKTLNVIHVGLGVESFSDKVLRGLNKTGITAAVNQAALDLLSESGFDIDVTMIYATPFEGRAEINESFMALFQNLRTKNITRIDSGPLRPYPGTRTWREAKAKGIVSENMDWTIFLNPIPYSGQVIEELYLGEKIDFETCRNIHREWKTKYTLLRDQLKKSTQGTMFIKDGSQFMEELEFLDGVVQCRYDNDPQSLHVGDTLVRDIPNPVFMVGCWPEEGDEWFWMSKSMTVVIKTAIDKPIVFEFMALDFFEEIDILPMTLTVRCNGQLFATHVIEMPGVLAIRSDEFPACERKFLSIDFAAGHSFIPAVLERGSDTRELSMLVRIADVGSDA